MRKLANLTLIVAVAVVPCGCGGSSRMDVAPVSGTITYQGKPVADAEVTFHPVEGQDLPRGASGRTDAEGKYSLTTYDTGDGTFPGEYAVTIRKMKPPAEPSPEIDMNNPGASAAYDQQMRAATYQKPQEFRESMVLPFKYADPKTTPEKRTVMAGEENVFNFELTE